MLRKRMGACKRIQLLLGVLLFLNGCGESSIFEGLGDDSSPQARKAAAQRALDKADCGRAVNLFKGLQEGDPNSVDNRLDLSAAYLCQAGFSVQGLLNIVADFTQNKEGTKGTLFQKITAQVATLIPDETIWKANVCNSKALLGTVNKTEWPCTSQRNDMQEVIFFQNDRDAGYILSIVNLADATLAIADALNTIGGIAKCVKQDDCKLTLDDLRSVADSLKAAAQSGAAATESRGELFQTTDNLVFNADTDKDKKLSDEEILNYLVDQKVLTSGSQVKVPDNCTLNAGKYTCTSTTST